MQINQESMDIRKAMAYDLLQMLRLENGRNYTYEELEEMIRSYIARLSQE